MNKRTIYLDQYGEWERVTKTTARKHAANGEAVLMHPCNLSPYYGMGAFRAIYLPWENDFDKFVNAFMYYNCVNTETGMYPAYYVRVK